MTDRGTARHRAPRRASTPLTTISTGITLAVGDRIEALGRGGAVIAVSSGLVASMALPAGAVDSSTGTIPAVDPGVVGITASIPVEQAAAIQSAAVQSAAVQAAAVQAAVSDQLAGGYSGQVAVADQALLAQPAALMRAQLATSLAATAAVAAAAPASASASAVTASAASAASAAVAATRSARVTGSAVVALAARYVGVRYRYGGSKPSGFDCSGYTQYVFSHLGFKIPRTANQQLHAVRRIPRSQARAGDLVFFVYGNYATHVAIYAGGGLMYDSPHSGKRISKRKIYSAHVVFGRVIH